MHSDVNKDVEMHDDSIQTPSTSSVSKSGEAKSSSEPVVEVDMCTPASVSGDPAMWVINEEIRDHIALHGIQQNTSVDFSKSKRVYGDNVRFCTEDLFKRKMKNGELQKRSWLVYSENNGSIYCVPCLLFGDQLNAFSSSSGFNDWKNAAGRIHKHESSQHHRSSVVALKVRGSAKGRIDRLMVEQMEEERQYWRNVLKRVCATVKTLATRGLPFRGTDEELGSLHNGNYLGLLELVSEFDPFLLQHLKEYGNVGSGHTSYLSKTVYEEIIKLISDALITQIVSEAKIAKYYGISVDSTPDISHVDQLTFILRYIRPDGIAVERFMGFIANVGHKSQQIADIILSTLEKYGLDIKDCRGQSYDNASNMSGAYSGVQARIKNINPLAQYVPCAAHSLNLVASVAAECCQESSTFFSSLQLLYNFFTASTNRWSVLMSCLSPGTPVVKSLSQTRWSARQDACQALREGWVDILKALEQIADNVEEKKKTRNEAESIFNLLNRLETAIMTNVWGIILKRFKVVSMKLQSVHIDLGTVVQMYSSLAELIRKLRDNFEHYEQLSKAMCEIEEYQHDIKRKKKHNPRFDERKESYVIETGKDFFRINTFNVLMDEILVELGRRSESYTALFDCFSFLEKVHNLTLPEISTSAANLLKYFNDDLEDDITEECIQLSGYLKCLMEPECKTIPLSRLCKLFHEEDLIDLYPNVHIALRLFLTSPATNCSGERSFSTLRRVKNYLRGSMAQERLNALSLLAIEGELVKNLGCEDIIDTFAEQKSRRKHML
ncbi:zinc finger MYM-type protein 1-like [Bombina bombina]|uniref:zinc finger MYM-type protein 1-like n=1 Tax=Bombina bombina TaxID=8345 RepID=UPI00235B241D|nr:zinc finger MYM-type protein 1-like [Bombina bombina]